MDIEAGIVTWKVLSWLAYAGLVVAIILRDWDFATLMLVSAWRCEWKVDRLRAVQMTLEVA